MAKTKAAKKTAKGKIRRSPKAGTFLSSGQAAAELSVSVATLYAYVSRGLVRSEPAGGTGRSRRYRRSDIEELKQRREQRRDPRRAAAGALSWGAPVLDSAITLIDGGRLFYRGRDVAELVDRYRFEEVAQLIWLGELEPAEDGLFESGPPRLPSGWRRIRTGLRELHALEVFQVFLPMAAREDLSSYDLRPAGVARCGARIVRLLTQVACGSSTAIPRSKTPTSISRTLQKAWAPGFEAASDPLDTALVICADHELNVSSFTARCVASAGSTPYDVVAAGLAAMRGTRHGGASERAASDLAMAWAAETGATGRGGGGRGRRARMRASLARRLKNGERIAGFGHPIYPEADPRYPILLRRLRMAAPDSAELEFAVQLTQEVDGLIGVAPNIDFGLATLSMVLGLAPGSAITLFALGRTVGWIGQAMEQIAEGRLIRPRARYTGPAVGERS